MATQELRVVKNPHVPATEQTGGLIVHPMGCPFWPRWSLVTTATILGFVPIGMVGAEAERKRSRQARRRSELS